MRLLAIAICLVACQVLPRRRPPSPCPLPGTAAVVLLLESMSLRIDRVTWSSSKLEARQRHGAESTPGSGRVIDDDARHDLDDHGATRSIIMDDHAIQREGLAGAIREVLFTPVQISERLAEALWRKPREAIGALLQRAELGVSEVMMTSVRTCVVLPLFFAAACKHNRIEDIVFDQPETLPGFTVSLPAGKRLKSDATPAAGEIVVETGGAIVTVGWQAGTMPREDLPSIAAAMWPLVGGKGDAPAETTELVLPAGNYGSESLTPTDKKVLLGMSIVQCATSNVTVLLATTASDDPGRARAFQQRLVATLQCGDEASALSTGAGLPKFTMDDTIGYLPGSDPPAYFSLAGARWYVTPGVPAMRAAFERPEVVAAMMSGLGLTLTEQSVVSSSPAWLQVQAKIAVDGKPGFVLAGVLTCGDAAYAVIHTRGDMVAPDAAELQRVQCPDDAVDPATLPTVSDRFVRACDSGDAQACEVLAMLVEEEPTLLTGHDSAKLRARACELGARHLCAGG